MRGKEMLHEFLLTEREAIIALCARKFFDTTDPKLSSGKMEEGLSLFYDDLTEVLKKNSQDIFTEDLESNIPETTAGNAAARHGEIALKLGYTVSQVVHGYGSICQGITEYAQQKDQPITVQEFKNMNLCLDIAIAESLTEYARIQRETSDSEEIERLGFLAHEMRNALTTAVMSFFVIKNGSVGVGGKTSRVLENAHERMRDLIDRSLTEVRLRSSPAVVREKSLVLQLVSEVEASVSGEASARSVRFSIEVAPNLEVLADHHLLVSALGNLVQNAIKFTKPGSTVGIRAREAGDRVVIEIEDQCGGLSTDKMDELFKPFTQMDSDRSGVGLGLAICRQAVALNEGILSARDVPGKGCVFTMDLPRAGDLRL
jgi:hypothetical protein